MTFSVSLNWQCSVPACEVGKQVMWGVCLFFVFVFLRYSLELTV